MNGPCRPTALRRRQFLTVGTLGLTNFGLTGLLRSRAQAAARGVARRDTSVVWLWLQGGAPHIETFDPKMDASAEYRSVVGATSTSVPGIEFGALLPRLAKVAHHMAIVRSFTHTNADHLGASHYVLTASDAPGGATRQLRPSFGSMAAKIRGANHPVTGMPTFVRLSRTVSFDFDQPLWLGAANTPFDVTGDSRNNLKLVLNADRLKDRQQLRQELDQLRREVDQSGMMLGMDSFEQQASDLILGQSIQSFDLANEDLRLRERYGPGLGEQLLTARRLCEAGCGFVMLNYGWAPKPAETPFAWDMHLGPSQHNAPAMDKQLHCIFPMFDQAIAAFVEDLYERDLDQKILLVVTGDFGRTPKLNEYGGRDHWPGLSTLALVGGGLKMGQVVGRSSSKAEFPLSNPIEPKDLMATIFHVLGIPAEQQFLDFGGRPQYLLPTDAHAIADLI